MHKIPLEMSRLTDEDLVHIELIKEERMRTMGRSDSSNEEKTTRAESMAGMPQVQITTDELESNILHRGRTYIESKKSMMGLKREIQNSEEEMKNLQADKGGERSQSLYCRSSDCDKAELEDFELIKVIG